MSDPVRVFIGASERQAVPALVLEDSIRRHTAAKVEVTQMYTKPMRHRMPRDKVNRPRTPFSFQRFGIPDLCGRSGRAIYLDSDMLVFGDVAEIHSRDFDGSSVLSVAKEPWQEKPAQHSVMLINCEKVWWSIEKVVNKLDSRKITYERLMDDLGLMEVGSLSRCIDPEWNHLDFYEDGSTKLLHYTNMTTQPWLRGGHSLESLWIDALREACNARPFLWALVEEHERRGWLRQGIYESIYKERSHANG